jgi:DHA1 family bicyclomycin/chloramphenicol resistance-like MFS transporter
MPIIKTIPGRGEFVVLIASIMMVVAFAIDSMLPALPFIGKSLGVSTENYRQFIITAFMLGFGIAQFFVGTLSDRYGRRGLMLWSLIGYSVFSLVAAAAPTFELLLLARATQGVAAAGARVLVTSVVRDRFEGRAMAQVMSLASVVFMAAPILAPTMGTLILAVAPWQWIFVVLGVVGVVLWLWVYFRLPESLDPADRIAISWAQVTHSWGVVLADRQSTGYTIGLTFMTCAIFGFLTSVQQIFADVFHDAGFLPIGFAIMAGIMAVGSFINSVIVKRLGMRKIGHAGLIGFTLIAACHAIYAMTGRETMASFIVLQSAMMFCFAMTVANFSAMAMENVGHVAGTASSLQGSFSTIFGAVGGALIGQMFDGTTVPLYTGIAVAGLLSIFAVFVAERGALFVSHAPQLGKA